MRSPFRIPAAAAAGVLTALLVSGCGGGAPAEPAPEPVVAAPAGHSGHDSGLPELWAVQSGPLGVVTTDGAGRLLYRSDADSATPPTSNCTGPCTETWKPVLLPEGQEPALLGVDRSKVGQLTRPDGTVQLTLGGWPLYYNATDEPGLTTAGHHGENGWSVITPTGEKAGQN
ncbi:Predicted lipoprotein with conserved Yx(FWY)xxD motif [Pseudonocardia thermophila]|jgi:Uncharacterized protein conserved in bacteria|uniref:Predicted lipoprotein with conserved Yx(FWY)xxD motif n=1 Tax=Pseudonocardia thermophila TaxID=1848 RepID=A0A1M6YHP9_PSETH|nr:hypothetical protein [Pseudonocardia thermophila]SHL17776.1 Predicted lipoprotein with conserved Yx(FWY)xxD motif [Pseudonocardia thermophila]